MRAGSLWVWLGIVLAAAVAAAEGQAPAAAAPATPGGAVTGWVTLFDGKDLSAWDADPAAGVWVIGDQGELYPNKGGPTLYTRQRYCDFVLELDFRVASGKKSNSGIFLRVHNPGDPVNTGLEIQVLDNADYGVKWDAMNANGALYDLVHPAVDANAPLGEWNHARITVDGSRLVVVLNGKEIVTADLAQWATVHQNPDGGHNKFAYPIGALPREGFIGLQNYGGAAVWFRNIRLQRLSDRQPQYTGREPIADVLAKPAAPAPAAAPATATPAPAAK